MAIASSTLIEVCCHMNRSIVEFEALCNRCPPNFDVAVGTCRSDSKGDQIILGTTIDVVR